MAANYHRPKPVDPIWYRQSCYLNVLCACGHSLCEEVGPFAKARRVSFDMNLYRLIDRLRCSKCGREPLSATVTLYRRGN